MSYEFNSPESRNEAILQNILGADNTLLPPESRIEVLLQILLEELDGSGGGTGVVVDSSLSPTSKNPLQNHVIYENLETLFDNEAAIKNQLPATISGIAMNTDCCSMMTYATDLNDIVTSGFYNAVQCQNAPFDYMMLIVCGYYAGGFCLQIASDVNTGAMKRRNLIANTWTNWTNM